MMARTLLLLSALSLLARGVGAQIPCTDGMAGPYSCSGIDLLGHLPLESMGEAWVTDLWGWTDPLTSAEYALVCSGEYVSVIDVTVPTDPVFLARVWAPAKDIKVYADHMFIVADVFSPMAVFDLRRLRAVTAPTASLYPDAVYGGSTYGAHNLAIDEETGFLYKLGDRGLCAGLHMVDVRAPLSPQYAGCFLPGSGYVHDAQCVVYRGPDSDYAGREVCFTSSESEVVIVDVEDKASPVRISAVDYPTVRYVHQGWLTEDQRWFLQGDELDDEEGVGTRTYIWDMIDLDEPVLHDVYEGTTQATDHNLYIRGTYAYEANYQAGLRVIDISDIDTPFEAAYFDTHPPSNGPGFYGAWTAYPFLESGNILVSSRTEGLFVLGLRVPVGTDSPPDVPTAFDVLPNYPNPFRGTTTLSYALATGGAVHAYVSDLLGRRVADLSPGFQASGSYTLPIDATGLSPGVYLWTLTVDGRSRTGRMVVAR